MQKVDKPKKPLLVYYLIALVAIILVNQVLFPAMVKQEVKEVDYGTFLTMLSDKTVAKVELSGEHSFFLCHLCSSVCKKKGLLQSEACSRPGRITYWLPQPR